MMRINLIASFLKGDSDLIYSTGVVTLVPLMFLWCINLLTVIDYGYFLRVRFCQVNYSMNVHDLWTASWDMGGPDIINSSNYTLKAFFFHDSHRP